NRFLLTYQFFFILGGLAALSLKQARAFVLSHGKWIVSGFVLALAALWLHFLLQVDVYHESLSYATSVLQPVMVFYSPVVIMLLCWLACRWASRTDRLGTNPSRQRRSVAASATRSGGMQGEGHPKGYRFWHTLS